MKKKILLIAVLAVMITGCGEIPKTKNGEDVLVELKGGTKYSVDEIWEEFKSGYALDLILKKVDAEILNELYEDNKEDIDQYISDLSVYFKSNFETEEALNDALNRAGYASLDKYLEELKVNELRSMATTKYAETKVSDKDIEKYYKSDIVGDIEAVHILVKPAGTDSTSDKEAKEKAEKIIEDIKKTIKNGKNAKEVFESYKDIDDTSIKFEDLGRFNKGKMVEAFETAVYKLKKNEYTKSPVKTSYGYHIILKTNEYEKKELKEVKDDIKTTLAQKLIEEDSTMEAQAMNELRKKNNIKFYDKTLDDAYNKYMNYLLNQK